ncbi:uncharacterized protein TNCV_2618231 [Trichonephila clavipes]|nr:uncharacterized protein TNCV_2618231 [Trichonephila clavipes]
MFKILGVRGESLSTTVLDEYHTLLPFHFAKVHQELCMWCMLGFAAPGSRCFSNCEIKITSPGTSGSLPLQCSRQEQTILTHFRSGHLRTLTFKDGNIVFPTCVRCSACQASPVHILDCLGLSKQNLYEDPLMVLDFLRVNEIMDLV